MKQRLSFLARAAVSLLLSSSATGCSFIFVRTPPSDGRITSRVSSENCTSSKLAPGFDTAFGALELVRTGLAATAADSVYENPGAPLSREADIALGASFAALFVGSAIYGFVNTSRCSRLAHDDEQALPDPPERWGASTHAGRPAAPQSPPVALRPPAPAASNPPPPVPEQPSEAEHPADDSEKVQ